VTISNVQLRVLALAGVFQAASLVKQLAKTGRVDDLYFSASIQSIFKTDPKSGLDIYEDPAHLSLGLHELIRLFTNNKQQKDPEIARYTFSMLHLERKLSENAKMLELIRIGIQRASNQALHFSPTHENVMANLASVYTDTLSTFRFRIHISGEPLYLNQPYIINKIRALLLAGIRSAVLWQQLGGRRWQLLISRTALLQTAKQCLEEYAHADTAI
jgi:high frequency lysogenization protein